MKAILYTGRKREIEREINIYPDETGIYKTRCPECGGTGWWNYAYPENEGPCNVCKGTGQIYITG
jgi:DnaJ-class molecular chaperone